MINGNACVNVDKHGDKWQVRFVIDNQQFDIGEPYDNTVEDHEEAEWFAEQFGYALDAYREKKE